MGVRKNLTKRKKDKDKSGSKCEECEGWIGVYIRERDGDKETIIIITRLKSFRQIDEWNLSPPQVSECLVIFIGLSHLGKKNI